MEGILFNIVLLIYCSSERCAILPEFPLSPRCVFWYIVVIFHTDRSIGPFGDLGKNWRLRECDIRFHLVLQTEEVL